MPIVLERIFSDIPAGDLAVVHPSSSLGWFEVQVPAGGSISIRHQIMDAAANDPTITSFFWMSLMTPIFSWHIRPIEFDLTLEVITVDAQPVFTAFSFKTFLIKAGTPHCMDGLHVPSANSAFTLHNSDAAAVCNVSGFVRMRSM